MPRGAGHISGPPLVFPGPPAGEDEGRVARRARDRGLRPLPVPANYYDDLRARFDLADESLEEMQRLGVMYDRDAAGEFTHFYTQTIGGVFFEVVQRGEGYEGYGAPNAPVRLAAQHLHDARTGAR